VVDLVYGARPTPLVSEVIARGGAIIDGYDVLLNQVRKQFYMMTGQKMPATIGRQNVASHAFGNPLYRETELHVRQSLSRVKDPAPTQIEALLPTRMNIAKA
jgi:hypothetical protein